MENKSFTSRKISKVAASTTLDQAFAYNTTRGKLAISHKMLGSSFEFHLTDDDILQLGIRDITSLIHSVNSMSCKDCDDNTIQQSAMQRQGEIFLALASSTDICDPEMRFPTFAALNSCMRGGWKPTSIPLVSSYE